MAKQQLNDWLRCLHRTEEDMELVERYKRGEPIAMDELDIMPLLVDCIQATIFRPVTGEDLSRVVY